MSRMQLKVNFLPGYNWFEFKIFLVLDHLPYHGERDSLSYYLPIAGEEGELLDS